MQHNVSVCWCWFGPESAQLCRRHNLAVNAIAGTSTFWRIFRWCQYPHVIPSSLHNLLHPGVILCMQHPTCHVTCLLSAMPG